MKDTTESETMDHTHYLILPFAGANAGECGSGLDMELYWGGGVVTYYEQKNREILKSF